MMETGYEAALFDMDGLLLDSERAYRDAFLETQDGFGLPRQPDLCLSCVGVRSAETDLILRTALPRAVPVPDFRAAWDARVAARLSGPIPLRPGVRDLLVTLRGSGVRMGVAASTRTGARATEAVGVGRDVRASDRRRSGHRGQARPGDLSEAGCDDGRRVTACAAFEDSNPGACAAVSSGARTVQVPDLTVPTAETRALGHVIAEDVLDGAIRIGLIAAPA